MLEAAYFVSQPLPASRVLDCEFFLADQPKECKIPWEQIDWRDPLSFLISFEVSFHFPSCGRGSFSGRW
jgi:hypothetical protein